MSISMTIPLAVALGGIFAASATVGSALGFGFSAVGCLVLIIWGPEALTVLNALSLVAPLYYLTKSGGFKPRDWMRTRGVAPAILGGLISLPFGIWLLHALPAIELKGSLGIFLGVVSLFFLLAPNRDESNAGYNNTAPMFCLGLLAGLTAGFASFPLAGIIAWLRYNHVNKQDTMALSQPILIVLQIAGILFSSSSLAQSASYSDNALVLLFGIPATIIGSWIGQKIFMLVPQNIHGRLTGVALSICSAILVVSAMPSASAAIKTPLEAKAAPALPQTNGAPLLDTAKRLASQLAIPTLVAHK